MGRPTRLTRSEIMSRIRRQDTAPELIVRSVAHALGYRFRLHRRELPGTPDLVFPMRRKVIFVHGCFWHAHRCPTGTGTRRVQTNSDFWAAKFTRNKRRDARVRRQLQALGWNSYVVWECQCKDRGYLARLLRKFLG